MLERFRHTVYVLEPDDAVRDGLRILLDCFEIEVRCFSDAESFMRAAASNTGGCALIENRLPDGDGLTLLSRLQALGNAIPVVLLSSSRDTNLATRALELGAAGVICKPLLNQQLLTQLASLLQPTPPGLVDFKS